MKTTPVKERKLYITERSNIRPGSENWYVQRIEAMAGFDCIKAFTTEGDIRPPFAYQWIAYAKVIEGDDDPFEGYGKTPHEAIKDLYKNLYHYLSNL